MKFNFKNNEPKHVLLAESKMPNYFFTGIANLSPAYFSLVMATGIVSIAAQLYNRILISNTLFWINLVAYIILGFLFAARLFFIRMNFVPTF